MDAADGLREGAPLSEAEGAPNFALRRFTLAPGAEGPRHTNEVEHEQYVLAGTYTVGLDDEEVEVSVGDSLLIPAGVVHWYRNDGDEEGAFLLRCPTATTPSNRSTTEKTTAGGDKSGRRPTADDRHEMRAP